MSGRRRRGRQQTLSWSHLTASGSATPPRVTRRARGAAPSRRGRSSAPTLRSSRRNLVTKPPCESPKEKEVQEETTGVPLEVKNRINSRLNEFFAELGSDMEDDEIDIPLPSINDKEPTNSIDKKDSDFYTLPDSDEDNNDGKTNFKTESHDILMDSRPSTSKEKIELKNDSTANDSFTALMNMIDSNITLKTTIEKDNNRSSTSEFDSMLKSADAILKEVNAELSAALKKNEPPPAAKENESSSLSCPICLETLGGEIKACSTHCGHLFCQPCIYKAIELTKKCPTCRKGLSKKKVVSLFI